MRIYRALLIGNGEKVSARLLKKLAAQADYVLAADGGANHALACGITPDGVIGDLDSVSPRVRRALQDTPFIHLKRQDNTDFEKALDWSILQQFDECMIAGIYYRFQH